MACPIKTLKRAVDLGAERSLFDIPVTTFRNGERGVHHFVEHCSKLNAERPLQLSTTLLALPDRVCASCFESSLASSSRNAYQFVRDVLFVVTMVDRTLHDTDTTKIRRTTNAVGELETLADELEGKIAEATERAGSGFTDMIRQRLNAVRAISAGSIDELRASVLRTAAAKLVTKAHMNGEFAPYVTAADDVLLGRITTPSGTSSTATTAAYRTWLRNVYEHGDYLRAGQAVVSEQQRTEATDVRQFAGLRTDELGSTDDLTVALQKLWRRHRDERIADLVGQWEKTHRTILGEQGNTVVGIIGEWSPDGFAGSVTAVHRPVRRGRLATMAVPVVVARWLTQPGNTPQTTIMVNPALLFGRSLEEVEQIAEISATLWDPTQLHTRGSLDAAVTTAALL